MIKLKKAWFFRFFPYYYDVTICDKTQPKILVQERRRGIDWLWFRLEYVKPTGKRYEFVKELEAPEDCDNNYPPTPPGHIYVYGAEDFTPRLYKEIA